MKLRIEVGSFLIVTIHIIMLKNLFDFFYVKHTNPNPNLKLKSISQYRTFHYSSTCIMHWVNDSLHFQNQIKIHKYPFLKISNFFILLQKEKIKKFFLFGNYLNIQMVLKIIKQPNGYQYIEFQNHPLITYLKNYSLIGTKFILYTRWWRFHKLKKRNQLFTFKTIQRIVRLYLNLNNV